MKYILYYLRSKTENHWGIDQDTELENRTRKDCVSAPPVAREHPFNQTSPLNVLDVDRTSCLARITYHSLPDIDHNRADKWLAACKGMGITEILCC